MNRPLCLILLPPTGPLEIIAVDILGPPLRRISGNRYVVINTDRYSVLAWAVSTSDTSTSYVATIVFDDSIIVQGAHLFC